MYMLFNIWSKINRNQQSIGFFLYEDLSESLFNEEPVMKFTEVARRSCIHFQSHLESHFYTNFFASIGNCYHLGAFSISLRKDFVITIFFSKFVFWEYFWDVRFSAATGILFEYVRNRYLLAQVKQGFQCMKWFHWVLQNSLTLEKRDTTPWGIDLCSVTASPLPTFARHFWSVDQSSRGLLAQVDFTQANIPFPWKSTLP